MIKEKELSVLITRRNISYYKLLGYNVEQINTEVLIKIEDVNKNSHQRITAVCELCNSEHNLSLYKYYKNKERYGYYGCKKCSREKSKKTNLERYGDEYYNNNEKTQKTCLKKYGVNTTLLESNTKEKIKKTNLEKYGSEQPLSSDMIREKSKNTLLEKYGVDSYSKTLEFSEKFKKTILSKYGVEHPMLLNFIKDKLKQTNIERYGCIVPLHSQIVQDKINNKYKEKYSDIDIIDINRNVLKNKCKTCGGIYEITKLLFYFRHKTKTKICTICNPIHSGRSGKEILLYEFLLENYDGQIFINDRKQLCGKEIDIFLPELNIAIEFNGMFWHSELYKTKYYHQDKLKMCLNKNINLISIWENDWDNKNDIIKSLILKKIQKIKKIKLDKYEIKKVNISDAKQFLLKNHINGYTNCNQRLGLYNNNELLSIILLNEKKGDCKILRHCDKNNINSDSFEIFMKHIKKYKTISLTVDSSYYIDDYFGFKLEIIEQPSIIYKINKTETQIMSERNFFRVYNAGKLKYKI